MIESAHVASQAEDRSAVDAFHAAATSAGGKEAGLRACASVNHPSYYAAFVSDPDGNKSRDHLPQARVEEARRSSVRVRPSSISSEETAFETVVA